MLDPFASPRLAALFQPLGARLGLATLPSHVHEIALSYALFNAFSRYASPYISARLFPDRYAALDERTRINWDTRVTSQLFQVLVLSLVGAELANVGRGQGIGRDWQTRLWGYDGLTGLVQALATGYFSWDAQVSALHIKTMGADSLAHALGWLLITVMGFRPVANYYGMNFMLYELSTPFLNNHWFLDKLGMTGSRAQLINGVLLIGTFALCRLLWGSYQSVLLYHDVWQAWKYVPPASVACEAGKAAGLGIPMECKVMPAWLAVTYVGGTTVLGILNFWWFNKMLAAVRKRFKPQQKGKRQEGEPKKEQ